MRSLAHPPLSIEGSQHAERMETSYYHTGYFTLFSDLRQAFRIVRAYPGVTAAALAALALGIGVNTAIFSLMDAVLLRPLPYPDPERLMSLASTEKGRAMNTSWPTFRDWQEQTRAFETLAAYSGGSASFTGNGDPSTLSTAHVTPEMFHLLGVSPVTGALPSSATAAILSHGFWMRRFAGDREAIGRTIILDGHPYALAGVLPDGFQFPKWTMMDEPDVYLPLLPNPDRRWHYLRVIGRLKPGVTIAQARADMDAISAGIEKAVPSQNLGEGASVRPLYEDLVSGTRETLTAFGAAVVFVLLIACANVSNLLLSQAVRRQREIAIRSALGASRIRLLKQLLVENLVLSLGGGALGIFLAVWGMRILLAMLPAHTALSARVAMGGVGLNWRVFCFALAVSVVSSVLFGMLPAWRASRADAAAPFLGSRSYQRRRLQGILIMAEVGLSLVLVAGAGLLIKSFFRLLSVDPGFNTRNLLTIDIELPDSKYPDVRNRAEFVRNALRRLESVPGVTAAAAINVMPLTKASFRSRFNLPGASEELGEAGFRAITPGYFEAMGIPLIRGRLPAQSDRGVGVINQAMAERYWPNDDPIGKVLETPRVVRIQTAQVWTYRFVPEQFRIVGIVGNVRHLSLDADARPEMFLLYSQMATSDFTILLRTTSGAAALAARASREIWAIDRDQPIAAIRTMDQLIRQDVADRRFVLLLLIVFAGVAVSLAAGGIFAVVSHSVSQRTREIGIRVALGADAVSVMLAMVRQTLLWISAGVILGGAGAFATGLLLSRYLYTVAPRDPVALSLAATVMAAIAIVAAIVPARDAARVDPAMALRSE